MSFLHSDEMTGARPDAPVAPLFRAPPRETDADAQMDELSRIHVMDYRPRARSGGLRWTLGLVALVGGGGLALIAISWAVFALSAAPAGHPDPVDSLGSYADAIIGRGGPVAIAGIVLAWVGIGAVLLSLIGLVTHAPEHDRD